MPSHRPHAHRWIYGTRRWRRVRLIVLNRAGWRCERCGAPGRLEVHHVEPLQRSSRNPFDPAGLRVLCRPCHFADHGHVGRPTVRGRAEWQEWLKS